MASYRLLMWRGLALYGMRFVIGYCRRQGAGYNHAERQRNENGPDPSSTYRSAARLDEHRVCPLLAEYNRQLPEY